MSRSRYRPKWPRSVPGWFTRIYETRPLRREFQRFLHRVVRLNELDALEPRERKKLNYWD